jgi:hypothetical protein
MESRRPIIKRPPPARAYGPGPKQVPKPSWYPVEQTWRGFIPKGMTADKATWPTRYVEAEAYQAGRALERRLAERKKPSKSARLLKGAKTVVKGLSKVARRAKGRSPIGMAMQGMEKDTAAFRKALAKKPKPAVRQVGKSPMRGGPNRPPTTGKSPMRGGPHGAPKKRK